MAKAFAPSVSTLGAQPKQTGPQLKCTEIKDASGCKAWSDCRWAEASGQKKAGCVKAAKK